MQIIGEVFVSLQPKMLKTRNTMVVMKGRVFLLFALLSVFVACNESDDPQGPPETATSKLLDGVLQNGFGQTINIKRTSKTYAYLLALSEEAIAQSRGQSEKGLPLLYQEKNFPYVYNYYKDSPSNDEAIQKTMVGWLCAMQLSELCPSKRNEFYRSGYEAGGFTMYSNVYGYSFKSDPNVARLVASAIYSAMHTTAKPDIEAMRAELGGSKFIGTMADILENEDLLYVDDNGFYVDMRYFLSSAPGPYAPDHQYRGDLNPTFGDEKLENGCLKVDMDIYNHIVENYNLPNARTVQAIADKDGDLHHIFGTDKRNAGGKYDFNAVFGPSTIGETINPEGKIAAFTYLAQYIGSAGRAILQHANSWVGPYEYGRLRPGCSEHQEALRKSFTDDRLNVLSNFVIEDNDGNKATYDVDDIEVYYYDENGNWTHQEVQSEEEYESMSKDQLYANSYPSGHSAGIWSMAMTMMELYPQKADLIMRAANDFSISRTICRYHWNSDVIQGKIVGSVMNPICHATSDYNDLLQQASNER